MPAGQGFSVLWQKARPRGSGDTGTRPLLLRSIADCPRRCRTPWSGTRAGTVPSPDPDQQAATRKRPGIMCRNRPVGRSVRRIA